MQKNAELIAIKTQALIPQVSNAQNILDISAKWPLPKGMRHLAIEATNKLSDVVAARRGC